MGRLSLIAALVLTLGCGALAATWQVSYGYYTGQSIATGLWPPNVRGKRLHILDAGLALGAEGTEVQIGLP